MIISAIVATAKNNVIGRDNNIPWYLPADLKYFKKTTLGHHIIMGRKSFISIGRPLPKRINIIITRDPFFMASGCAVVHSLEEALAMAKENGEEEVFIIGGGQIYDLAMPFLDKIYLTEVDIEVEGEISFPKINEEEWVETNREAHVPDEKNEHAYIFRVLEKKG
ncbi:MAG TPA: dihydrofolate reductase [Bacteroidetes bacterium]|nr:dihydrofolate reductase [Bacteroidota bacterium]